MPPMTRHMHDHRKNSAVRGAFRELESGDDPVAQGMEELNAAALDPKVLEAIKKVRDLRHVRSEYSEASVFAPTYRARMKQAENTETEATLCFGHADAEVAELRHLVAEFHGDIALDRVQFVRGRQHFPHREVPRHFLNHASFVIEIVFSHFKVLSGQRGR